ncbi:N-acetyl-gamma-glutamyl-phosphate reductase [Limnochorda pilosa]|uniref:N-acetyl-gamma-glutamyl-phosphate reductase n=1 Tax=Limnochorda pilosa TaxID=1555112 RepID=A0A0K2SJQ9_LIMPI|nr:N-acetyl-gamma-glutamyl-phosphate reductase [Limnochorda pilosa]BAS27084.1 N-acetyl-gamma-glutamyl-phosphate reductase [Limnochorda pilosa]
MEVGVLGASGYAGSELVRLLLDHPAVTAVRCFSSSHAGEPVGRSLPGLAGFDGRFEPWQEAALEGLDVVFTSLPAGEAVPILSAARAAGVAAVDVGSDLRLAAVDYPTWYGYDHPEPTLLQDAVYGLPELWEEAVRRARLVANPGCYPTAVLLALAPLAREGLLPASVQVSATSGHSGAGRTPRAASHLPAAVENVQPYAFPGHRHVPEMERYLARLAGRPVQVSFLPQLVPASRGILAAAFIPAPPGWTQAGVTDAYRSFYQARPFVRVLDDELPQTAWVRGSNRCDVAARLDPRTGTIACLAALDNLVKGAAGQAIQNMNLMVGLEEAAGLPRFAPAA